MTPSSEALFVDSSVWVHALRDVSPLHQLARECLLNLAYNRVTLCTSVQVIRELCALLQQSDPQGSAVNAARAAKTAASIGKSCNVVCDSPRSLEECLHLVRTCNLPPQAMPSANIVAVMRANTINRILTAEPADYSLFTQLIEIVPLATAVHQFSG